MSAVVILLVVKFSRFLVKDKSENTFIKYVMARELLPRHHKNNKFFANDNTLQGLVRIKQSKSPSSIHKGIMKVQLAIMLDLWRQRCEKVLVYGNRVVSDLQQEQCANYSLSSGEKSILLCIFGVIMTHLLQE